MVEDLRLALCRVLHSDNHTLGSGNQIHRAAHAGDHLAWNHPVGETPLRIYLKAAEHGHVDVTATDKTKGHCAVEGAGPRQRTYRPPSGIGEGGVHHAIFRDRAGADQSVLRLEIHVNAVRNVVGNQSRNADAEIDEHTRSQLSRDAPGDDGLCFHRTLKGW